MSDALLCSEILPLIISDFGKLWHCKPRGDSIEIITPFSTATQKFVSVFIARRGDDFIVTDGGLLEGEEDVYDFNESKEESEAECFIEHFCLLFAVTEKTKQDGRRIFYKKCTNANMISSGIYDLCNFLLSVTSASTAPSEELDEEIRKETFRKQANCFLLAKYGEKVKFLKPIDGLETIKFSAIVIPTPSTLCLIAYVTGSTNHYFSSDLRKAIVNFELANKSKSAIFIQSRVALLDNNALGYAPNRNLELLDLLGNHKGRAVCWADKSKLD